MKVSRNGVEAAVLFGGLVADVPALRVGIERMLDDRQLVTKLPRGVRMRAKKLLATLRSATSTTSSFTVNSVTTETPALFDLRTPKPNSKILMAPSEPPPVAPAGF